MTVEFGKDLLRELIEVRNAATFFEKAISAHNFLPDDFPRRQVNYLVLSLCGLPDGSLEGVRAPLEHAGVRLSEVRRKFFFHSDISEKEEDVPSEPTLERGDSLDQHLVSLLSAISTALDAYREQARSDFESTNTQEYLEVLPQFSPNDADSPPIERQIQILGELSNDAKASSASDAKEVSQLGRSAANTRNLLASTKAEVESKFVIRGWLRTLSTKSADALKILRVSIDVLETAGGVAADFYRKFKGTIGKVRDLVIDESKDWLKYISQQLERAEKKLREAGQEKKEKLIGIIRAMSGQKLVVTKDDIPFALHPQERVVPQIGRVVSFNVDMSDGKPLARDVRENFEYIILNQKLIKVEDAYTPVMKIIEGIVASSNLSAVPISHVERKATKAGPLPDTFWRSMGYSSLGAFASSGKRIFTYPNEEGATYLSLMPFSIRPTSMEAVKDWAFDYLSKNEGEIKTGDLAQAASHHFSNGVISVRHQLGGIRFSEIFLDDSRFIVERGAISLAQQI